MQYLVMILAIVGVVLNVFKRPESFVIWTFTNAFWVWHNFKIDEIVQADLFAVMMIFSIYGAIAWYMEKRNKKLISAMRQFEFESE